MQPVHESGYTSADQIVREAPEVAFGPDFGERSTLSKRNHRRHRHRIGNEINARSKEQQRRRIAYHPVKQAIAISAESRRNGKCGRTDIERNLDRSGQLAIQVAFNVCSTALAIE